MECEEYFQCPNTNEMASVGERVPLLPFLLMLHSSILKEKLRISAMFVIVNGHEMLMCVYGPLLH